MQCQENIVDYEICLWSPLLETQIYRYLKQVTRKLGTF